MERCLGIPIGPRRVSPDESRSPSPSLVERFCLPPTLGQLAKLGPAVRAKAWGGVGSCSCQHRWLYIEAPAMCPSAATLSTSAERASGCTVSIYPHRPFAVSACTSYNTTLEARYRGWRSACSVWVEASVSLCALDVRAPWPRPASCGQSHHRATGRQASLLRSFRSRFLRLTCHRCT